MNAISFSVYFGSPARFKLKLHLRKWFDNAYFFAVCQSYAPPGAGLEAGACLGGAGKLWGKDKKEIKRTSANKHD